MLSSFHFYHILLVSFHSCDALNFEYAAELRDEISELRKLVPKSEIGKTTGTSAKGKDSLYKSKRIAKKVGQ